MIICEFFSFTFKNEILHFVPKPIITFSFCTKSILQLDLILDISSKDMYIRVTLALVSIYCMEVSSFLVEVVWKYHSAEVIDYVVVDHYLNRETSSEISKKAILCQIKDKCFFLKCWASPRPGFVFMNSFVFLWT